MTTKNGSNTAPLQGKPDINYPCYWQYKVIGQKQHLIKEAIIEICSPIPVSITFSHSSSSGKYHSFNAEIEVVNEEARMNIYKKLQNHPAIKVVL